MGPPLFGRMGRQYGGDDEDQLQSKVIDIPRPPSTDSRLGPGPSFFEGMRAPKEDDVSPPALPLTRMKSDKIPRPPKPMSTWDRVWSPTYKVQRHDRAMRAYEAEQAAQQQAQAAEAKRLKLASSIGRLKGMTPEAADFFSHNPEKFFENYSENYGFNNIAAGNTYSMFGETHRAPEKLMTVGQNEGVFDPDSGEFAVDVPEAQMTPYQEAQLAQRKAEFEHQKENPRNGITVRPDGTVQVGGPVQDLGYGDAPKGKEAAIIADAENNPVVSPGAQQATYNKLYNTNQTLDVSDRVVVEDIDRALALTEGDVGAWVTTGFAGSLLDSVPGTAAHDLAKTLDTVKANIGFDKLQQMRDNSPTGGALGQVSNLEIGLLQSVLGNLEQSQTLDQFRYNIQRLKDLKEEFAVMRAEAFAKDYPDLAKTAEFRGEAEQQKRTYTYSIDGELMQ